MPWSLVRKAFDAAFQTRMLERPADTTWPCDFSTAGSVTLNLPAKGATSPPPAVATDERVRTSSVTSLAGNEVQDLSDAVPELLKASAGYDLEFRLVVALGGPVRPPDTVVTELNRKLDKASDRLKIR